MCKGIEAKPKEEEEKKVIAIVRNNQFDAKMYRRERENDKTDINASCEMFTLLVTPTNTQGIE